MLSSLVGRAVLKYDDNARRVLKRAIESAGSTEKLLIQKRLAACAVKALNSQNYPGLRKVYTLLLAYCPAAVCEILPDWQAPSPEERSAALFWIWSWPLDPFYPEPVRPYQEIEHILCKIARVPSTMLSDRQLAVRALTHFDTFSHESCQIMLCALSNHTDRMEQLVSRDVIQWSGKFTPFPEKVVPLLVEGLVVDEDEIRSDCADALRRYGPRARFVVEPLVALAKTNHWQTASSAAWALKAVDPEAAMKAGIN